MPDVVPAELGGKWIAWDDDAIHIVGAGDSPEQAIETARAAGVDNPWIEKAPPANAYFIGKL